MKGNQQSVTTQINKANHELLEHLLKTCYIDVISGCFHCKACRNIIHIDWSRGIAYCPVHGMLNNVS